MRTRYYVYADQLADASRCRSARICRSFHSSNIATHDRRHGAGTNLFVTNKRDVSSFHHCIGGFDHCYQSFCFNHSECFLHSDAPHLFFATDNTKKDGFYLPFTAWLNNSTNSSRVSEIFAAPLSAPPR